MALHLCCDLRCSLGSKGYGQARANLFPSSVSFLDDCLDQKCPGLVLALAYAPLHLKAPDMLSCLHMLFEAPGKAFGHGAQLLEDARGYLHSKCVAHR